MTSDLAFPSGSGMAVLDATHLLLIDDTKDKPELAERPRLRIAGRSITFAPEHGTQIRGLPVQ